MGSRGMAPLILSLSTRWRWVASFTLRLPYPQKRTLVSIEKGAG